jgi:beta-aspartyl-peptidase (threonine type)
MRTKGSIIVHGGAGGGKYPLHDRRVKELRKAVEEGMTAMGKGSALDGVEAAVVRMEESGAFNAGRGACTTIQGKIELDAAVMNGRGRTGAGVGLCTCTYHPVSLARKIMDGTKHVLVAGEHCRDLARINGIRVEEDELRPSPRVLRKYSTLLSEMRHSNNKLLESLQKVSDEGNTVGAVALDPDGVPAAAVSTGGLWMKIPGRIGDSAVIGAGIYADDKSGAACATGIGEEIIRNAMSLNACVYMQHHGDAAIAARKAVSLMTKRSGRGTAGIITVDLRGRTGFAYNTTAMGRAWYDGIKERPIVEV